MIASNIGPMKGADVKALADGPGAAEAAAVAAACVMLFLGECWLARHFAAAAWFSQYNILFDADPNVAVGVFAHGRSGGGWVHAGVALLIDLPLGALQAALSALLHVPARGLRESLALGIAPLFISLMTYGVWRAVGRLAWTASNRIAAALIVAGAFSTWIFGAVPESYSISGYLYALLLGLVTRCEQARRAGRSNYPALWQWLGLAGLMSVVTLTNGVIAMACWAVCARRDLRYVLNRAALSLACIAMLVVVCWGLDRTVFGRDSNQADISTLRQTATWARRYAHPDAEHLVRIPAAMIMALWPPQPRKVYNPLSRDSKIDWGWSFQPSLASGVVQGLGWLALCTAFWMTRKEIRTSALVAGLWAMLGANLALHAIFGREPFLYSMHWTGAMAVLLVLVSARINRIGPWIAVVSVWLSGISAMSLILAAT